MRSGSVENYSYLFVKFKNSNKNNWFFEENTV